MKKYLYNFKSLMCTSFIFSLLATNTWSQAPESMSYTAVIRDAKQVLVSNKNIGMKVSILKSKLDGQAIYVETHSPTANAFGQVSLEIGIGKVVTGNFSDIQWGTDKYFLKTETDPTGGTDYAIKNTSQLLSVPYALYAKKSGNTNINGPFTHHIGQEKDGGIIFYLYIGIDGKEHGLIVHKNESAPLVWQTTFSNTGATSDYDGKSNTEKMTNSPAKNYVTSLGKGWYIPSVAEIHLLGNNRFFINNALAQKGGKIIRNDRYHTSTEYIYDHEKCYVHTFEGRSSDSYKSHDNIIRAIRAF